MAQPPKPLGLTPDALGADVPQWARVMVEQLNAYAASVNECLEGGITRSNTANSEKVGLVFTTKAAALDTFPISVKHGLDNTPRHVQLGKLERDDAAVVTAGVSMTWRASSDGQVLIWFQGLSNSTKYRVSLTFE